MTENNRNLSYRFLRWWSPVLLSSAISLNGATYLKGDISTVVFDSSAGPFIVESDCIIPFGKKVVIGNGCRLLFKPFSGLAVQGSLIAEGTADHPVVFSSINNDSALPQGEEPPRPFDWNGISIYKNAPAVRLRFVTITYSVYGVKSLSDNLIIENGIFRNNGQFNFTINGAIIPVADGIPFNYRSDTTDEPAAGTETLVVETDPAGATVCIDGKAGENPSPVIFRQLVPLTYTIKTVMADRVAIADIAVTPGKENRISLKLKKQCTSLKIESNPPYAEVYLNRAPGKRSEPRGKTPLLIRDLPDLRSRLTLFKPGFSDTTEQLNLSPHRLNTFLVDLHKAGRNECATQQQMLGDRRSARIGRFCFAGTGGCIIAGAASYLLSRSDYATARRLNRQINSYLNRSNPECQKRIKDFERALHSGAAKQNASLFLLGTGLAAGGTGIILYF
jgi:hypothetical protein